MAVLTSILSQENIQSIFKEGNSMDNDTMKNFFGMIKTKMF